MPRAARIPFIALKPMNMPSADDYIRIEVAFVVRRRAEKYVDRRGSTAAKPISDS